MRHLMQKFEIENGDITFFLILFERQVRLISLDEEKWVSSLLGLLPYEITKLTAREPVEKELVCSGTIPQLCEFGSNGPTSTEQLGKTGSGRRKVTSARDDRHLSRMAVNDRTASSWQLAARWSTATGVLMSASSIRRRLLHRGLRARLPLYKIPLTANLRRLRQQWAHEHRAWQADWHYVVFSDDSRFNLWDHDGRICVRRYAGERCLLECII
ncbi:transposable element Tc1 transposase [Trichonephila clavipes]|nr:transposable element Tc1 transposase [Trichonephila clavipes]